MAGGGTVVIPVLPGSIVNVTGLTTLFRIAYDTTFQSRQENICRRYSHHVVCQVRWCLTSLCHRAGTHDCCTMKIIIVVSVFQHVVSNTLQGLVTLNALPRYCEKVQRDDFSVVLTLPSTPHSPLGKLGSVNASCGQHSLSRTKIILNFIWKLS